jgi:hypothetical protein
MGTVGRLQHRLPLLGYSLSLPVVQHGRCEQTDTAVVVMVVPGKEGLTKGTSIFNRAELLGELRLVLSCQVRGVQALTTEDGTDLSFSAAIRFLENPQLVLGGVDPTLGLL